MDGYHVSHDPARPFTTEPTTGRKLNILDVPAAASSTTKPKLTVDTKTETRRSSQTVARGRALSPSRIVSPKPQKPSSAVEDITRSLSASSLSDSDSDSDYDSDDSDVPSLTSSRSSACSSPASAVSRSSSSSSNCSCQRFGITRKGDRVKLDCGGSRCGGDDSDCSDSEPEEVVKAAKSTRRQGVVIRNSRR